MCVEGYPEFVLYHISEYSMPLLITYLTECVDTHSSSLCSVTHTVLFYVTVYNLVCLFVSGKKRHHAFHLLSVCKICLTVM
jgi:hypothetical protein